SASLRYVPAASSTLQIDPALQPSSSVHRRKIRSSSGRRENSPARSSATAISPAALAAAPSGTPVRPWSADTSPPHLRQQCLTTKRPAQQSIRASPLLRHP